MIRYEEIEAHLIDFLEGKAEESAEYRIKAYLQQNPDFQQELDELAETLEFSQATPIVQPTPELKMNFYAMLNDYKAHQVRPTLRTRLKAFLITQFQWQTITVGAFTVLLLIVGYWSVLLFQTQYKATQVSMTNFEFEKEQKDQAPLILPTPKRREKTSPKQTESLAQGREEASLPELKNSEDLNKQSPEIATEKYAKDEAFITPEVPAQTHSLYSFDENTQNGTVEINNPLGNIHLRSYTGTEVKVESVPTQGFKGEVIQDKVTIQGLATAPQIDMQVYVPQNRNLLLNVNAQQNIVADLANVQVATNSQITSFAGNVEVNIAENTDLEITASGREIVSDFEERKDLLNAESIVAKTPKRKEKESKKDNSSRARANSEKPITESQSNTGISASDINHLPAPPAQEKSKQIVLKKGNKKLKVNSLQGKTTLKKSK